MRIIAPLLLLPLAMLCPAAGAAGQAPASPTVQSAPQSPTQSPAHGSTQNSAQNPASSQVQSTAPAAGASSSTTSGGRGLTVVRDAETGRLRAPTPDEMRALQRKGPAALAAPAQPTVVTGADGRRHVQLGESGLVYSVVRRGPDGKLDQQCVHGAEAAGRALAQPAPGADQEARHDHR